MTQDLAVDGTPLWDGYTSTRDRDLRRHYGLKLAHFEQLLERQGEKCAIESCSTRHRDDDPLQVDEDPASRKIRGLLCRKHNRRLDDDQSRYITTPPAADLGWTVPEKQWQTRQARNAGRARRHQAAREAKTTEEQTTPEPPPPSLVDRIRDMTQQDPADFQARLREALEATTATTPGWSGGTVRAAATVEAPPREEAPAQRRGLLGRLFG